MANWHVTAEEVNREVKEQKRLDYKAERDSSLQSIIHDFGDGRIVQVRPQDVSNFKDAISFNEDQEWIMEDNSVVVLTVNELQTALDSGLAQGKAIWATYINNIKNLGN